MKETQNDAIGIGAYDAFGKEYVQVAFLGQPPRTIYLVREEAILLADRIRRKAEALPDEPPTQGMQIASKLNRSKNES